MEREAKSEKYNTRKDNQDDRKSRINAIQNRDRGIQSELDRDKLFA